MKRLLIVFIGLAFGLGQVVAQGNEQPVDTRITEVKVFQGQAQVVRNGRTRISAGKTDIVLRGLTAALDPGSIQVAGRGNFTILGISHRQNFMEERAVPRGLTLMEDSLILLGQYMWLEKNQKTILEKEEQMLLSSQNTESKERPTVAELKATADFLRARLQENALLRVKAGRQDPHSSAPRGPFTRTDTGAERSAKQAHQRDRCAHIGRRRRLR